MITTLEQAVRVQKRRRDAGLKGRSKAVRRWFKRTYGRAVEAHGRLDDAVRDGLAGDFSECRTYDETYLRGETRG